MYKLRFVYICDHCGEVRLPALHYCGFDTIKTMPRSWGKLGEAHLCDRCYAAYKKLRREPECPKHQEYDSNGGGGGGGGYDVRAAYYREMLDNIKKEMQAVKEKYGE